MNEFDFEKVVHQSAVATSPFLCLSEVFEQTWGTTWLAHFFGCWIWLCQLQLASYLYNWHLAAATTIIIITISRGVKKEMKKGRPRYHKMNMRRTLLTPSWVECSSNNNKRSSNKRRNSSSSNTGSSSSNNNFSCLSQMPSHGKWVHTFFFLFFTRSWPEMATGRGGGSGREGELCLKMELEWKRAAQWSVKSASQARQ